MFQRPIIKRITMEIEHADGVDKVEVTGEAIRVEIEEGDIPRDEENTWGVMGMSFTRRRWDIKFLDITHLRIEPLPKEDVVQLGYADT